MSEQGLPVTVAVSRPDGTIEHVRVGTAVRQGESFVLRLGELSVGSAPERSPAAPAARRSAATSPGGEGMVFPPYGRSKGQPIAGATMQDLEYYANGCRRTLNDPGKARWHDKERVLLAAIEAEIARQSGSEGPAGGTEPPPHGDEDIPF